MNHTQQIIQDAIKGGCNLPYEEGDESVAFLNPLFWQAVGKVREWKDKSEYTLMYGWEIKWHQFIDHLAEGDDYETALSKLERRFL